MSPDQGNTRDHQCYLYNIHICLVKKNILYISHNIENLKIGLPDTSVGLSKPHGDTMASPCYPLW